MPQSPFFVIIWNLRVDMFYERNIPIPKGNLVIYLNSGRGGGKTGAGAEYSVVFRNLCVIRPLLGLPSTEGEKHVEQTNDKILSRQAKKQN